MTGDNMAMKKALGHLPELKEGEVTERICKEKIEMSFEVERK